jgi:hypothetical protein
MSHIKSGPHSGFMQFLALTTAATMAFSAVAQTTAPISHPFVTDRTPAGNTARNVYTDSVIKAAKSVSDDPTVASNRARSYAGMLEEKLASLPGNFNDGLFVAPVQYLPHMFQLHGVTPTTQFPNGHATMCAAQSGKALGAWKIYLSPTSYYGPDGKVTASFKAGQVVARPVVPNTPDQVAKGKGACYGTLVAAVAEIKADHGAAMAQAQAGQPTSETRK